MKNLKEGFTSMLGALIIISVLAFVYQGKTTFTEAGGYLTIGVALLFSSDEHFTANFLPFLNKSVTTRQGGVDDVNH
jgi:hypothetical protein